MSEQIALTLQRMINEGLTSAREIGELIGVSPSTVYRWINGESQPDYNSIRLLVRHLPSRTAQQAILVGFTAGTSWQMQLVDVELDVNQDGRIGPDDALDSSIHAVQSASDSLIQIRESLRDGRIQQNEAGLLLEILAQVVTQCTVTQQLIVKLSEDKRKKLS